MSTTQSPSPSSDAREKPLGPAGESAGVVLGLLKQHLDIRSVLDVGCGAGAWLSAAREAGVPSVMGVDGAWAEPQLTAVDPALFRTVDLNEAFDLGRSFDLVVSIEAGSRVRPTGSATFVRSLARHGDAVLFSAALPGQGGGSVNECWPESWAGLFDAEGFDAFDIVRRSVWGDGRVEPAVQQNALLFLRRGGPVPDSLASFRIAGEPATVVHRLTYSRALRRIGQLKQELKDKGEGAGSSAVAPAASFQERILRQATAPQVAELIAGKLRSDTPCSLVRLSHCESKFINWPDVFVRAEINKSLRRQFGYADLTDEDIGAIAARIRGAVTSSDIVGVPVLSATDILRMEEGDYNYMLWSKVAPACERYGLLRADTVVTSPNIHLRLQDSDFLDRMVEASPTLTLIGCRDLRVPFRRLGFTDVEHIPVPEAYRTRQRDIPVQRHYPDAFDEIVARIRAERRRGLFFVGAGVLGKVYCQEVRLAGGVAVDVGSVMDVWAGVVSRTGFEKRVEMYTLDAR